MNSLHYLPFIAMLLLLGSSCRPDDDETLTLDDQLQALISEKSDGTGLSYFIQPAADDFASIPQDPKNPITAEKVALGKLLYHETALGIAPMEDIGKGTYSCASCHFAEAGFQAGRFQGIGDGGVGFGIAGEGRQANSAYDVMDLDVQPLRSPTTLNVAYQTNMLWNGQFGATGVNVGTEDQWTVDTPKETNTLGFEGVEIQAIAGLGVHRMDVDEIVEDIPSYKAQFDQAFSDVAESERYTKVTAGLAIAAYERTLLPNQSKFQDYLKGNNNALSQSQKLGAMLFFGRAECVSCHTGPALNKMDFVAIGTLDLVDCGELTFNTPEVDPANLGRGGFTKNPDDNYKFKIPQLYNLKDSPFYMHGSTFDDLRAVMAYKNAGLAQNSEVPAAQLDPNFKPLNMTGDQLDQLTDFIANGLHDPNLGRYVPDDLPSGSCFPMNDPQSQIDLGCN